MCRLFGSISRKPTGISYWFFDARPHPFKDFSEPPPINGGPHDDGWGIAWMAGDKWEIFKEGKREKYDFSMINGLKSKLFIVHLRRASKGFDTTKENAHPFQYKNWVFAHNGGVEGENLLKHLDVTYQAAIQGKTDSEIFFLIIMQFYEETGDLKKALQKSVELVKETGYRALNFLLSDGRSLYAYRAVNPNFEAKNDYYSLHYLRERDSVIFGSDPLDDDRPWKSIGLGELIEVSADLELSSHKII